MMMMMMMMISEDKGGKGAFHRNSNMNEEPQYHRGEKACSAAGPSFHDDVALVSPGSPCSLRPGYREKECPISHRQSNGPSYTDTVDLLQSIQLGEKESPSVPSRLPVDTGVDPNSYGALEFATGQGDRHKVCPNGQGSSTPSVCSTAAGSQDKADKNRKSVGRQAGRRANKKEREEKAERETPQVAVEFNASKAAENPAGFSVFQLNATSITPAVEEMIVAFSDDAYHMQETMKDYAQTLALFKRLRKRDSSVQPPRRLSKKRSSVAAC